MYIITVICAAGGETRLVGGSTDREGRVEVCANRRWRTVCTGSQDLAVLARGVCLRTRIRNLVLEGDDHNDSIYSITTDSTTIYTGSTVAVNNSFPPGAFPEYSLECMQQSDKDLRCTPVQQQCDSFVDLGVVCKNYEDLRNECSRSSTLSTLSTSVHATTPLPSTTCGPIKSDFDNSTTIIIVDNSPTFIAVIGILVSLLLAVSVGWIVSCGILLRRGQNVHKQQ